MLVKGVTYFEKHFYYSSKFIQLIVDFPSRIPRRFRFRWILFYMTIFYVCPGILHQFYQLIRSEVTLQSTVKVLQNMITALCILCFYIGFFFNHTQMQYFFVHIKIDYEKLFVDDELQILEMYERRSKIIAYSLIAVFHLYYIVMLSPCFFNICFYFFTKLENVQLMLPFPINNVSSSGPVFYILLIYQTIAMYILIFIASMCYSTILILLLHILCQFSLIRMKIGRPFRKKKEHIQNTLTNYKLHDEFNWIKDIINSHVRIIEFVDRTNVYFKDIYLIALCWTMFLIILDFLNVRFFITMTIKRMFQLLSVSQNKSELVENIIYITGSILITYIMFYGGQELINQSTQVFEELCNVPFYTLSIKTQKLLIFMITRCIKPCHLSIGDLFIQSHEVFSKMMQKAFSLATVYYNVR